LQEALEEIKSQEGVGQAYIVVTDVIKVNSHIIYTTDEEEKVIEKAFTAEGEGGIADIGPKMSRKKDIAPAIEKTLN
jgi:inorganic pyrophosphatase/exopolyphosphatase